MARHSKLRRQRKACLQNRYTQPGIYKHGESMEIVWKFPYYRGR